MYVCVFIYVCLCMCDECTSECVLVSVCLYRHKRVCMSLYWPVVVDEWVDQSTRYPKAGGSTPTPAATSIK